MVYMCIHMYVQVHGVCGVQGVEVKSQCCPPSLIPSSSYFLRQDLLVDLKLSDLAKLADQQASEILFSLLP